MDFLLWLISAFLSSFIAYSIHNWYRLRHVPGPIWISFSKFWQLVTQIKGNWGLDIKDLGDEYGNLFRIGPNQVITTDVDVIRQMAHPRSKYSRSPFYQTFRFIPTQDHTFSLLDEAEHSRRRTILGPGYSGSIHVEECVNRQCARLVDLIERKFISDEAHHRPLDMTLISFCFSMDCVGDMSFGQPFGYLDDGEDIYRYIKWNKDFFSTASVVSNFHWLTKIFFKPPFNKIYPSTHDTEGVGKYLALATEAVQRRMEPGVKQRRDVLGLFIEQGVTEEEAINELMLQVVAGTDSTAAAMRMTLLYLVSSPMAYNKLKAEIDDAISEGAASSPIKDSEARKLPYLQAVIKEGLRIFPVVTATFFKKVPEGGDTINGHFLPEGTEIGHNVLGIMRSAKYWGTDADAFRPERWLEADGTTLDMMNNTLEVLWGAGRYKCLGRAIVGIELNKVYVELLRRFDFAVAAPHKPIKMINSGFFLMSDINMRVIKRA